VKTRVRFIERIAAALSREEGFALVLALGVSMVLGIAVTTMADYTFSNTRSASSSSGAQLAYTAAEAGLNDALTTLFSSGSVHTKTFQDGASQTLASNPSYHVSYTWTATVNDPVWTLTGTGTVQNVSQGSRPITHTLKRTLRVQASAGGSGPNMTVWNYIYSDAPPGSPCMPLANNSAIATPLYIRGDLCISNNAHIDVNAAFASAYPTTPQLQVGGKITMGNNAYIGTSSQRLNGVLTGAGCGSTPHNPCSSSDGVWANQYLAQQPTLTKPVIDLATWYKDAAPGPNHPCTSPTGTPPAFDNDTTQNNSLGTVNLTPATAYDCKFVDATGATLGELKWTPSGTPGTPGQMVVSGTVFFDGDLSLNTQVVYSGRGTMYFAGSILFNNNAYFCGILNCTSAWDSTNNLVVMVAGSNAQSPSAAINLTNNAIMQGAMEANGDFTETNNVGVWGAIIAHQVFLSNNAIDHYVPFGTAVPGIPSQTAYTESLAFTTNGFSG
jgi:Tfp pilus assembly protein PilX